VEAVYQAFISNTRNFFMTNGNVVNLQNCRVILNLFYFYYFLKCRWQRNKRVIIITKCFRSKSYFVSLLCLLHVYYGLIYK